MRRRWARPSSSQSTRMGMFKLVGSMCGRSPLVRVCFVFRLGFPVRTSACARKWTPGVCVRWLAAYRTLRLSLRSDSGPTGQAPRRPRRSDSRSMENAQSLQENAQSSPVGCGSIGSAIMLRSPSDRISRVWTHRLRGRLVAGHVGGIVVRPPASPSRRDRRWTWGVRWSDDTARVVARSTLRWHQLRIGWHANCDAVPFVSTAGTP